MPLISSQLTLGRKIKAVIWPYPTHHRAHPVLFTASLSATIGDSHTWSVSYSLSGKYGKLTFYHIFIFHAVVNKTLVTVTFFHYMHCKLVQPQKCFSRNSVCTNGHLFILYVQILVFKNKDKDQINCVSLCFT